MRRESAGNGRQQNRNGLRGRLLRQALALAFAAMLAAGSAGEAFAQAADGGQAAGAGESAGTSGAPADTSGGAGAATVPVIEYDALEELVRGSNPEVKALCDVCLIVPSSVTADIQEYHLPVYHTLCAMLEEHFFPAA